MIQGKWTYIHKNNKNMVNACFVEHQVNGKKQYINYNIWRQLLEMLIFFLKNK